MKPVVAWAVLAAMFIVVAWFMFDDRPTHGGSSQAQPVEISPKGRTSKGSASKPSSGEGNSRRRSAVDESDLAVNMPPEVEAMRKRMDEVLARAAAATTEDVQRDMLNVAMNKRKPHFDRLFQSWNFDDDQANAIRELVRAREEKLISYRMETARNGSAYVLKAQKKIDDEREATAAVLVALLGQERFDELAAVENEIFPIRSHRAR